MRKKDKDMLNNGEELFMFEREFFPLAKKWLEMDEIGKDGMTMVMEFDALERKYMGINKLYDEYVHSRIMWFGQMVVIKRKLKRNNEL